MARQERGLFRIIFKHFIASITPSFTRRKLVGTDYYGTKYYEVPITSTSNRKRPPRYFVPVNKTDFEQDMPAEWASWLRYRRTEPPTEEEILKNYQIAQAKKQNALALEASQPEQENAIVEVFIKTEKRSFPSYEEYKNFGRDYQPKHE